jgi:UDP-3-O-[3-hydroxymyristoyl] N-acetylglucosamine deacetylase / 3-hydroxyacyl-[acyl-carrier-protein] dehydratase
MDNNFNPDKQHTLAKPVSISGTGLHTGINVDMTLQPAAPGFGFQFKRMDLPGMPVIKADCDLVTDTSRGTTLEQGQTSAPLNTYWLPWWVRVSIIAW